MDKFDRIQQIHRELRSHRYPVSLAKLAEILECSERTIRRNIETMQRYGAPVEYSRSGKGWHYVDDKADRFELPGLWLTAGELQSLSLLLHLLENLAPNNLTGELKPVEREIKKLLAARGIQPSVFRDVIKILPIGHRQLPTHAFQLISEALINEQQLDIEYLSYSQINTQRRISPQALIYYRENWYLDAWCHLRKNLRTFSVARISTVKLHKAVLKKVSNVKRQAHFSNSYGIFSGKAKYMATLRFLPAIAKEISQQQWHPKQTGYWQGEEYVLTIPYADERELTQDILRYTPHVLVEAPSTLHQSVLAKLEAAIKAYST